MPPNEQRALVEAALCLAVARLLLHVPFRRVAPLLGQPQSGAEWSGAVLKAEEHAAALTVRRALLRIAGRLPWHSSCLVCALAGRMMLWRRRLPSILHLGARGGSETELSAHAWLQCGEVDVIGSEIAPQYTSIVAFTA